MLCSVFGLKAEDEGRLSHPARSFGVLLSSPGQSLLSLNAESLLYAEDFYLQELP